MYPNCLEGNKFETTDSNLSAETSNLGEITPHLLSLPNNSTTIFPALLSSTNSKSPIYPFYNLYLTLSLHKF